MIITLKGATGALSFEANRIGVLSKWNITRVIDSGVTYSGVTSVDKGASFSATLTLESGYAYSEGVTVTMGGTSVPSSCIVTSGSKTTITISSVTGNITIKALTYNTSTGESGSTGGGTTSITGTEIDLSSLTWTQGHYDASGNDTGTSGTYYNYRVKTDVIALPAAIAGKGAKLYFYVDGDYEINFRAGAGSNTSDMTFNYYLITSDRSVEDRGSNTGNRGYVVQLPSTATHMRMMLSRDDGSSNGSNLVAITPADAANAGLKISYVLTEAASNTMDLSSLTWEQGHYDNSTSVNTADTHQHYNNRLRSNVMEIPEAARDKTWEFYVNDDYEINFHAGTASSTSDANLSSVLLNYFLITSDRSIADRGSNSGNRGYKVTVPSNATHFRMMASKDDGTTNGMNAIAITPDEVSAMGLVIKY